MGADYDFGRLLNEQQRRKKLLETFAVFRQQFMAGIRDFTVTAQNAGIEGVSDVAEWDGTRYQCFAFGIRKFVIVSDDTVLGLEDDPHTLAARILIFYDSLFTDQPPVFDVVLQEHGGRGYDYKIERFLKGREHVHGPFAYDPVERSGHRAAVIIGNEIMSTYTTWWKNVPLEVYRLRPAEPQPAKGPLGFRAELRKES
jgi:hypothetical protein